MSGIAAHDNQAHVRVERFRVVNRSKLSRGRTYWRNSSLVYPQRGTTALRLPRQRTIAMLKNRVMPNRKAQLGCLLMGNRKVRLLRCRVPTRMDSAELDHHCPNISPTTLKATQARMI